jgi:hypothetical protein
MSKILHTQLFVGNKPEPSKLQAVSNLRFHKPKGGLWTSTWRTETEDSDWIEWCRGAQFGDVDSQEWYQLEPSSNARIYTIDSVVDLVALHNKYNETPVNYTSFYESFIDFERLSIDYDAIHLTGNGECVTRFSTPSLYGWDCESTIWFRWCFDAVTNCRMPKLEAAKDE